MNTQAASVVRLTLFKDSERSFLTVLDAEKIPHERVQIFSSQPQASGIVEVIAALSDAMPWNSIAKVIIAWIDARKSREVIIQTEDGRIIHAKGYSVEDVEKLLPISVNIAIIDTKSEDKNKC